MTVAVGSQFPAAPAASWENGWTYPCPRSSRADCEAWRIPTWPGLLETACAHTPASRRRPSQPPLSSSGA